VEGFEAALLCTGAPGLIARTRGDPVTPRPSAPAAMTTLKPSPTHKCARVPVLRFTLLLLLDLGTTTAPNT
jgi:hypothetical protein